ncbi:MAG: M23 family metallopeptidase [Anaerolineae bacterium]
MADPKGIYEPPIDPLADTNPSMTVQKVQLHKQPDVAGWRRVVGLVSLLGAVALTIGTAVMLFAPTPAPQVTFPPPTVENVISPTALPTEAPPLATAVPVDVPAGAPTISAEMAASILSAPLQTNIVVDNPLVVVRNVYDPFTFVKQDRPRSETIQYTAAQGDTIYTIAERFKLKPETIAWSNSRRIVLVLRPGDVINIPPTDGVYLQVVGSKSIQEWAAQYKVTDPYTVIDSEYNNLAGSTPETIPASGTFLFIPAGVGEDITWNPGVTTDSSGGATQGYVTSFAPGDPGSCGNVNNPGGGSAWVNPLPQGTYVRGFSSIHSGVDRAAPPGTPIVAANSGSVIFSGLSTWGYGNTVVLAHGPFLTLYGHMSSIAVRCGQTVPAGSVIGGVGSTGNSSGPHLHFEIRFGNTPSDPCATIGSVCS